MKYSGLKKTRMKQTTLNDQNMTQMTHNDYDYLKDSTWIMIG